MNSRRPDFGSFVQFAPDPVIPQGLYSGKVCGCGHRHTNKGVHAVTTYEEDKNGVIHTHIELVQDQIPPEYFISTPNKDE